MSQGSLGRQARPRSMGRVRIVLADDGQARVPGIIGDPRGAMVRAIRALHDTNRQP